MLHKVYKNPNLFRKQQEQSAIARADETLRQSKHRFEINQDLIDDIFAGKKATYGSSVAHAISTIIGTGHGWSPSQLNAFQRLLYKVTESDLLDNTLYIEPLHRLARWSACWLRDPATFKFKTYNRARQFSSLVRHLFSQYDVPVFMDSAWMTGNSDQWQEWFIHIATGSNIRKASNLPFPLTKMMAHKFAEAPDNFNVFEALRWGQVMGMGGNSRLAKAILGSKLRSHMIGSRGDIPNEEFWTSVINFFILHSEMLDMTQVAPIIDYIYAQKFECTLTTSPVQPGFSMQKRTIESLINQTEAWHRKLAKIKEGAAVAWESCGIVGYDRTEGTEGNHKRYWIEELLTSQDLKREGTTMKHCVFSYVRSCSGGQSAIYSMKMNVGNGEENRLTIEIDPKLRLITQARGKYNQSSTQLDKRIMEAWASKARLSFGRLALARWA